MNILFLSNLSGNLFAGPNNSVPAQVRAQSKLDRVFWYNLNQNKRPEWSDLNCKNLDDYPSGSLKALPSPFNKPDLVVVEELYCYPFSKILREIQKEKIPYIIVPRSEMTEQAQKKKRFKKRVGNLLYFNRMISKAAAVQYLSEQEKSESELCWMCPSVVVPNGTEKKETKQEFSADSIHSVYIGRFEKYQKGLDLLLEALSAKKDALRNKKFALDMYGVDQDDTLSFLRQTIQEQNMEDIVFLHGPVFGNEKARILKQADVFIMSSRFEGMPMGLIEALSYGLPTVATTGTNMADEIRRNDAGWTSDNSADGLANAMTCMIEDIDCFAQKSRNAVRLADRYGWDSIAKESHIIYGNIADKKKK